jgi:hypothetical protein
MFMGIFDGVPDRDGIRMQREVGLTTEGRVPQVGIHIAVDTGRTTNDVVTIFGNKQLASVTLSQFDKKLAIRNISFWFESMMMTQ